MYDVQGLLNKTEVRRIFHRRKSAINFAKELTSSEVYDMVNRQYVYGTSKFYMQIRELYENNSINSDKQ